MMIKTVHDLLKKISYIEADIELQKQILFSIPSDHTSEIENTIRTIAKGKAKVKELRKEIERVDPHQSKIISRIEESVALFKKISIETTFTSVTSLLDSENCVLSCTNGKNIDCLFKAVDAEGNWTAVSSDGDLIRLSAKEVIEKLAI